jgi:hypothetical protein
VVTCVLNQVTTATTLGVQGRRVPPGGGGEAGATSACAGRKASTPARPSPAPCVCGLAAPPTSPGAPLRLGHQRHQAHSFVRPYEDEAETFRVFAPTSARPRLPRRHLRHADRSATCRRGGQGARSAVSRCEGCGWTRATCSPVARPSPSTRQRRFRRSEDTGEWRHR